MRIRVRDCRSERAFSLIELLVVVAIIGILAAVGVVAYQGYTASAAVGATKANHANLVKWMAAELTKCDLGQTLNWKAQGGQPQQLSCGNLSTQAIIDALVVHLGEESWRNPHNSGNLAVWSSTTMPNDAEVGNTHVGLGQNAAGEILIQTKFQKGQHTPQTPTQLSASVICTQCQ